MFQKINCLRIIRDQIQTLYQTSSENKVNKKDIFTFYFLPFLISLIIYFIWIDIYDSDSLNLIATVVSIFAGLLLNLLLLIYDILRTTDNTENLKRKLLNEINTNISYCILVSIILILLLLIHNLKCPKFLTVIFEISISYLIIHFLLVLLLVLKRVYALLEKEYNHQ